MSRKHGAGYESSAARLTGWHGPSSRPMRQPFSRSKAAPDMHPGKSSERTSPEASQQAITRELWLVRGPSLEEETTELLGETSQVPRRRFDWIDAPTPYAHHESPAAIAGFQRRLRDAAATRAELRVALGEEDLRASRVTNRLNEEALSKEMRQRSRASTVRYLRSIVLLVALTWMLVVLSLSTIGRPVSQLTPGAVIRDDEADRRSCDRDRSAPSSTTGGSGYSRGDDRALKAFIRSVANP